MCKPHLLRLRFGTDTGRLDHHHVLILLRVVELLVLTVHALTDKEVGVGRHLRDHRRRTGIRTVGHAQPATCGPHHHVWCIDLPVFLDRLPMLQPVPAADRDVTRLCACRVELSEPTDADAIPIAGDFMVHLEGIQYERPEFDLLEWL